MLDIQLLRSNLPLVAERLASRGVQLDTATFESLEAERKAVQMATENLQAKRNSLSKQIGVLKGKGEDASAVLAEVAGIGDELKANKVAFSKQTGDEAVRRPFVDVARGPRLNEVASSHHCDPIAHR